VSRLTASLRLKIGLALFCVVAGGLAIVYLAVVPRLESRLVAAKTNELEASLPSVVGQMRAADSNSIRYGALAQFFQQSLNARVVVFSRLSDDSLLVVADSAGLPSGESLDDSVARRALQERRPVSGRVTRDGHERAEVAAPLDRSTVVLVSASLRDALANVRLVQRTLLVAGLAALFVSWLVGYLVAARFTRRIRRLEQAAEQIAGGDFEHPVEDPIVDEIGQLAAAFDAMRERLAQLDRARREFIANASHELRTPLFSLGGFLELLADEELSEAEQREFVAEMTAQVERLTKLATDLLDLSMLDAGQLAVEREPVDLAAAARTVCEEFRAVAEASGHDLRAEVEPAHGLGDEQRVLQIGRILVENALRHTAPGTEVQVRAGEEGDRAFVAVADTGAGLPEGRTDQLFERFFRGDGGTASGSGLGLAIARELTQRMVGTIDVDSAPGATVFTLRLARADVAEPDVSREKSPAAAAT
jgi:signal transduction histidine kinase